MDIETFYEENEVRRQSAEFEFGDEWSDDTGVYYELSWVEATGELYLMAEPDAELLTDPFGGYWPGHGELQRRGHVHRVGQLHPGLALSGSNPGPAHARQGRPLHLHSGR